MRAARNEADVGADAGQLYPEISADRAGAVDADLHGNLRESRMAKNFRRSSPVGFEGISKPRRVNPMGALSGGGDGSRRGGWLVLRRGEDIADTDDADQAVIVDHRQMANVVLIHQVTNMFEGVGRTAGDQLAHGHQLRNL